MPSQKAPGHAAKIQIYVSVFGSRWKLPRRRVRQMGGSTTIIADLGAEVPVGCVALIATMLSVVAIVRARLWTVGDFSVTLADTGLLNAGAQDESQENVVLGCVDTYLS